MTFTGEPFIKIIILYNVLRRPLRMVGHRSELFQTPVLIGAIRIVNLW